MDAELAVVRAARHHLGRDEGGRDVEPDGTGSVDRGERNPQGDRVVGGNLDPRHGATRHRREHVGRAAREERRVGVERDEQLAARAAKPRPRCARPRPRVVRVEPGHPRRRRERPGEAPQRRPEEVVARHDLAVRDHRPVQHRVGRVDRRAVGRRHRSVAGVDLHSGLAETAGGGRRRVVDVSHPPVEELVLVHGEAIGASGPEYDGLLARRHRAVDPAAVGASDPLEERSLARAKHALRPGPDGP